MIQPGRRMDNVTRRAINGVSIKTEALKVLGHDMAGRGRRAPPRKYTGRGGSLALGRRFGLLGTGGRTVLLPPERV